MTKNNIKTILFVSLIVAMILPFSSMDMVYATNKEQPRLLTSQDVEKLLPTYLELEQTYQTLKMSGVKSTEDKVLDVESEMINILTRVQEHKEAAKIANHIPEQMRLKMELTVSEISDMDIPVVMLGIDTKKKSVMVGISGEESLSYYTQQIREKTNHEVKLDVFYSKPMQRTTCVTQNSDCDPIVGGIAISDSSNLCTLALEVKNGWWSWADEGWVTAGHCFTVDADIEQPIGGEKIGTFEKRDFMHNGDCDCGYIKDTTETTASEQIWISSNTYKSIYGKSDAVIDDYILTSLAKTGGYQWGQVEFVNISLTDDQGTTTRGLTLASGLTIQHGDSGAPITEIFGDHFQGILIGIGEYEGGIYTSFSPWSKVSSSLGVY